jgi:hypothetical protein
MVRYIVKLQLVSVMAWNTDNMLSPTLSKPAICVGRLPLYSCCVCEGGGRVRV